MIDMAEEGNDSIAKLREEMLSELTKYKDEVKKQMEEKDAQIKKLTDDNKALQSEIVKATIYSPTLNKETPKEETEEDKAKKEWERITTLTKTKMKEELSIK